MNDLLKELRSIREEFDRTKRDFNKAKGDLSNVHSRLLNIEKEVGIRDRLIDKNSAIYKWLFERIAVYADSEFLKIGVICDEFRADTKIEIGNTQLSIKLNKYSYDIGFEMVRFTKRIDGKLYRVVSFRNLG